MKKYKIGFALCAIITIGFLASCQKDNVDETDNTVTFDCSNLQQDIGDSCFTAMNNIGVVTSDCECDGDDSTGTQWDCPNLQGNIGGICFMFGIQGVITNDCECAINSPFECPELQAYVNDSCWSELGIPGVIDANCDCIEDQVNQYDCPNLMANIGDSCWGMMNQMGVVDANCDCFIDQNLDYDCPDLQLNYGDICEVEGTNSFGYVNQNCDCQ